MVVCCDRVLPRYVNLPTTLSTSPFTVMFAVVRDFPGQGWYMTCCFFCADGDTEVITCPREFVCADLHVLLGGGIEGTVVG